MLTIQHTFADSHLRCHLQSEAMLFRKPIGTLTVVEMRHYESETETIGKIWRNRQRIPQDESTMRTKGLGFGPQCHRKGELQTWTSVLFHLTVLKRTDLGNHATPDQLSTRSRPNSVPLHSSLLLAICFCPLVFYVGLMRLAVRLGPNTAIMTGLML